MLNDIERVLLSEEQIKEGVARLGKQIAEEYADKNPVFIGILKGVVVYFADMIRATPIPCEIDFMVVSSYGKGTSAGTLLMKKDVSVDIKGRHVVILEDILDTGRTLSHVIDHLKAKGPASLKICTMLDKKLRHGKIPIPCSENKCCSSIQTDRTRQIIR